MKHKASFILMTVLLVFSFACQMFTPKMSLEERIPRSTDLTNSGDIYYYQEGDKIQAKAAYASAIEYYDQNARAYIGLANVYDDGGDFDQALIYYDKALEIDPEFGYGYFHRGIALKNHEQYAESIENFTSAIEHKYAPDRIYYLRGVSYDQIRGYENAYRDYQVYLNLDSEDNANTRYACGRVNSLSLQNSQNFLDFFVSLMFEPCPRFTETYEAQDYSSEQDEAYDPYYEAGNWQR
jgi:tetratricopeptide (TPR) repeat protein